ncbi:hypothetical protein D8674_009558 [Pyrus ussuriensis x Pyrus communis]|uniref:Uncharacterized protein n=1 Tax=Pyrus ussuriensis x Pyrus communis TaxID=2448454 RepID=A0A5N5F8K6_9ROSA|nr:hypothetical protein D8674_009558 [Pyrus ussuriensis x Pyrus communis]
MADSGEGSGKKKLVVRIERYRRKQVLYFKSRNLAEAYAEFKYDIGNLLQRDCSAKFESWKKVSHEIETVVLWKRFDAEEMAKMFNWEMKTLKNTRGPCRQLKTAKVTWVTTSRILIKDIGQHQWRSSIKSWKAMPEETKNRVHNQLSPSVPPEYISLVFLHHHHHIPSTSSKHSNQARRPPTPSPTNSKILRTTFL